MKKAALAVIAAACATAALADGVKITAYRVPVTRDGKTTNRLSYNFWSGEYPSPVIDLNAAKAGTTKVSAFASLRTLDKKVDCTLKNGVYNPWSKTAGSAKDYYTLRPAAEYVAAKPVSIASGDETIKLAAGDRVIDEVPLSEGSCRYTAVQGKKKREFETECESVDSAPGLRRAAADDGFSEQWLYVACAEGYPAFIQDKSLLAAPGAAEGETIGFGQVGPRKP